MKFEKVVIKGTPWFYWTWRDLPFLPYACLEGIDLEKLPRPFFLAEIHPECNAGFETKDKSEYTNIIELPDSFDKIKMDSSLRKDLRRIERKNDGLRIVANEAGALDKSSRWFLEQWKEETDVFARRMALWKQKCYTLSAYLDKELIAVHIAMQENGTVFYFGCWWNRKYRSISVPTFLLKKDVERAVSRKLMHYDLGIGNEPYKKKWGVIQKPTKYYAVVTKAMAAKLGIDRYVEM